MPTFYKMVNSPSTCLALLVIAQTIVQLFVCERKSTLHSTWTIIGDLSKEEETLQRGASGALVAL